jgi:RNA-directed DNA polymerase
VDFSKIGLLLILVARPRSAVYQRCLCGLSPPARKGRCAAAGRRPAHDLQVGTQRPPPEQADDLDHIPRYFGTSCKSRDDQWVFGDRVSGAYLVKHSWTKITRRTMVAGRASPDGPDLRGYWQARRRASLSLDSYTLRLLTRQRGRCPLCGNWLIHTAQLPQTPAEWEHWQLRVARRNIRHAASVPGTPQRPGADSASSLIHASCNLRHQARQRRSTALQPAPP